MIREEKHHGGNVTTASDAVARQHRVQQRGPSMTFYRVLADRRELIRTPNLRDALATVRHTPKGTQFIACERQYEPRGEWERIFSVEL
jgi:hypothetical protein